MSFTVLIPARLASTRLPNKPLADIAGKPMVVRVAERALQSGAARVVVACDDSRIASACEAHSVAHVLTRADHASGSDRLAQACDLLNLSERDMVVNVQGDEPLIDPGLIDAVAQTLVLRSDCAMSTAAHPITDPQEAANPNVVKVVLDANHTALYFSRSLIAYDRDQLRASPELASNPDYLPLRHVGLYAYRVGFFARLPQAGPSTHRAFGMPRATARPVARPSDCRACHTRGPRRRRGYTARSGAGTRPFLTGNLSTPMQAGRRIRMVSLPGCAVMRQARSNNP